MFSSSQFWMQNYASLDSQTSELVRSSHQRLATACICQSDRSQTIQWSSFPAGLEAETYPNWTAGDNVMYPSRLDLKIPVCFMQHLRSSGRRMWWRNLSTSSRFPPGHFVWSNPKVIACRLCLLLRSIRIKLLSQYLYLEASDQYIQTTYRNLWTGSHTPVERESCYIFFRGVRLAGFSASDSMSSLWALRLSWYDDASSNLSSESRSATYRCGIVNILSDLIKVHVS